MDLTTPNVEFNHLICLTHDTLNRHSASQRYVLTCMTTAVREVGKGRHIAVVVFFTSSINRCYFKLLALQSCQQVLRK